MNILVDMNLSPAWVGFLAENGYHALHWSSVGAIGAPDHEIMRWARDHGYMVFTHDLDFGAILAATTALGPSVFQVRTQDVLPDSIGAIVIQTLREFAPELERGALATVDESRSRVRILPLGPSPA